MFNIGDLVTYSAHGVCKINDICEKTVSDITETYYVLQPMGNNHKLAISIPVNNEKAVILELIHKDEAYEIVESFKLPGVEWNDKPNNRHNLFSVMVRTGDRKEIAKVINTLMRKRIEAELQEKKLFEQDRKLLNSAQNILFREMAITLNISFEEINQMVTSLIEKNK